MEGKIYNENINRWWVSIQCMVVARTTTAAASGQHLVPCKKTNFFDISTNADRPRGAEVAVRWRCNVGGESAGGNIVHHVKLRVADMDLKALKVKGLIALHPFFGSEEMVDSEKGEEMKKYVEMCNFIWSISLPAGSDSLQLPPVLLGVVGKDELRERGMMYYEYLKKCGKEVELLWEETRVHAYHITHPEFEGTWRLIQLFSNFVDTH
ncbi:hypothetical protein KI387_030889 [Taxus chinensis]|uniref:Alpha/beta hydrolase fold-3 domain-containing protein n=1 Tax=Taxus chinensis TaxID=29808 RepID=A0AA38CF84_TAXCH|nr:hypothetical protein KI387_030889 [Taxus chinensis]